MILAVLLENPAAGGALAFGLVAARRKHVLVSEVFACALVQRENKSENMIHATHAVLPLFREREQFKRILGSTICVLGLSLMGFYGLFDANRLKAQSMLIVKSLR